MPIPRFTASKPSEFAFASDEKIIRQPTTSFVRCYLNIKTALPFLEIGGTVPSFEDVYKRQMFATSELTSEGPVMKRMYGMVMDLNDCHAFAPSIFADVYKRQACSRSDRGAGAWIRLAAECRRNPAASARR